MKAECIKNEIRKNLFFKNKFVEKYDDAVKKLEFVAENFKMEGKAVSFQVYVTEKNNQKEVYEHQRIF